MYAYKNPNLVCFQTINFFSIKQPNNNFLHLIKTFIRKKKLGKNPDVRPGSGNASASRELQGKKNLRKKNLLNSSNSSADRDNAPLVSWRRDNKT